MGLFCGGNGVVGQEHGWSHGTGRKKTKGQEKMKNNPKVDLPQRTILKGRNPRLTPTESCESDETEEGVKPFRAPPGLPDPLIDLPKRIREPVAALLGCRTGATAKVESHLHPRYNLRTEGRSTGSLVRKAATG